MKKGGKQLEVKRSYKLIRCIVKYLLLIIQANTYIHDDAAQLEASMLAKLKHCNQHTVNFPNFLLRFLSKQTKEMF